MISLHDELTEILRILTSSLKWEGEEELYVRGGEWDDFLGEDWSLGGGDEEFEDDGFSLEGDFSLGGVWGGRLKFLLK